MEYKTEIILSTLAFVWMLFTATNINQPLGTIYTGFIIGSFSLLIIARIFFNKKLDITFSNGRVSTPKALLGGVTGWIILMIIQSIVYKAQSIIQLLGATALTLADSKIANFITFGIVIAYIETTLWARLDELFSDAFGLKMNRESLTKFGTLFLIGALSFTFMAFHITAKGIKNSAVLFVVFFMMLISLILVHYYQETKSAVLLHILANSIGSWYMFFR